MICKVCGGKTDILHDGVCFDCACARPTAAISAQWADASPVPTESNEQRTLFEWARRMEGRWPELRMLYHIPNEGKRSLRTGARMKAEGLKSGVPDICLPVPRGGNHGLYIELKRRKNSKVTQEQLEWIMDLASQGYVAAVCRGCDDAISLITDYMNRR